MALVYLYKVVHVFIAPGKLIVPLGSAIKSVEVTVTGKAFNGNGTIDYFDCARKGGGAETGVCSLCVAEANEVYECGWCKVRWEPL